VETREKEFAEFVITLPALPVSKLKTAEKLV
jgi:hypothetical protein